MNNIEQTRRRPFQDSLTRTSEMARFMSRVYLWMTAGVCLSGGVAVYISGDVDLAMAVASNRILFWGLVIAQVGAVLFLSSAIHRISTATAAAIYLLYAALTGVTLSILFLIYTQESIASVFALTAFSFAGLSGFGLLTQRDLGPVGAFCTMGLFGMLGFALLSMLFPSLMGEGASQVYGLVGVVVFAGLTAYDTQKIKSLHAQGQKGAVFGALTLYLDFINLFVSLLRVMGRRR